MWRKLAIALAAAVSLGAAAMPTDVDARVGGGGGGGHFSGGGFSGGRSFSPGFSGGRSFSPGFSGNRSFNPGFSGNRNVFRPGINRGVVSNFAGRHVINGGRFAMIHGHRHHGRRIFGLLPGIGYAYYWYYDDCYVWTDYGWINMCGYDY